MLNEQGNKMRQEGLASAREARRIELEQTFSYDGYMVVRKELFAHLRDPALTIRERNITFNAACINGLEDVVYIKLMINEVLKRIVISACKENDKDAVRWCIAKQDKRKSRNMTCPELSAKIYALMGWKKGYRYKMLGYKIQVGAEQLYIFDLIVSERFKENSRQRKGKSPQIIESAEALEDNNAVPISTRKGMLSEEIAASFGVPVAQHLKDTEIKNLDGYITAAMITGRIEDNDVNQQ